MNATITSTIATVNKQFGPGALTTAESDAHPPFAALSTGYAALDEALGGGWAVGRIVELFGPDHAPVLDAMRQVVFATIAATQRQGAVALIDTAHSIDLVELRRAGVSPSTLLISQPDNGEQALEIAESLVRSGAVSLVVIDSVAGLVPQLGEVCDEGAHARLVGQAVRKLTSVAHRSATTVLFVNPLSVDATQRPGANALKFYASTRVDVKIAGGDVVARVCKNKLAPPFRSALIASLPEAEPTRAALVAKVESLTATLRDIAAQRDDAFETANAAVDELLARAKQNP